MYSYIPECSRVCCAWRQLLPLASLFSLVSARLCSPSAASTSSLSMTHTPNRLLPKMTISYQELAKILKLERKTAKLPHTPQLHALLEASAKPTPRFLGENGQHAQHPNSIRRGNREVRCPQLRARRQTPHRRCPCGSLLDSSTWMIAAVHLPSQLRFRNRRKSRRTSQRHWRCDCTIYRPALLQGCSRPTQEGSRRAEGFQRTAFSAPTSTPAQPVPWIPIYDTIHNYILQLLDKIQHLPALFLRGYTEVQQPS